MTDVALKRRRACPHVVSQAHLPRPWDAAPVPGRFSDCFAILEVSDLRRSVGFNRDLLGFELTYASPSEDEAVFVSLALGDGKLALARADGPVQTTHRDL